MMNDIRKTIDIVENANNSAMANTFRVLNQMVEEKVLTSYALCGAMAAFEYIEPAVTRDIDVFVQIWTKSPILTFNPITSFLSSHGLPVIWEEEGLMIHGFPVQLLPVNSPLDQEALQTAKTINSDGVAVPIVTCECLMAKCLEVGRPKDQQRLLSFLETGFDKATFCDIVNRFGLSDRWKNFCVRFEMENFCEGA